MEFGLVNALKLLLLPPSSLILISVIAAISMRYKPYWSVRILTVCVSLLYLFSIPVVVSPLVSLAESQALTPDQLQNTQADAIVILSASRLENSPEYGSDVPAAMTLQRARYAAWLHRKTQYPIIVSGGIIAANQTVSDAALIQKLLQEDFNVPVEAIEEQSLTTFENARYTSKILKDKGFGRILLVSHALHLPRAKRVFEQFDIQVTPAPTVFYAGSETTFLQQITPSTLWLQICQSLFHELVGRLWYRIRY